MDGVPTSSNSALSNMAVVQTATAGRKGVLLGIPKFWWAAGEKDLVYVNFVHLSDPKRDIAVLITLFKANARLDRVLYPERFPKEEPRED